MTLIARREPTFDVGAHDRSHDGAIAGIGPLKSASKVTRLMTGAQMLSTLLAVPLGLASGYSIYRANFSPDTTCQNLRAGIIAMLDKNVDAATRHILVRRDVEAFEQSCGTFDPDATAAFKQLLAADKTKPAVTAAPKGEAPKIEPKPKIVDVKPRIIEPKPAEAKALAEGKSLQKAESHPATLKQTVAHEPSPRAEAAHAETKSDAAQPSDAAWISAVREALVKNGASETRDERVAVAPASKPAPLGAISPAPRVSPSQDAPAMAPALPQARVIAGSPSSSAAAAQPDADHPVPPEPVVAPPLDTSPKRSGVGKLIADIPLLGPMVDAVSGR